MYDISISFSSFAYQRDESRLVSMWAPDFPGNFLGTTDPNNIALIHVPVGYEPEHNGFITFPFQQQSSGSSRKSMFWHTQIGLSNISSWLISNL